MIARRPRWAILAASLPLPLGLLCAALPAAQAEAACSKPVFKDPNTFVDCRAIGAEQTFRVPAGVRRVRVIATGGGGGDGSFSAVCTGFVPTPPCTDVGPGGRGGVGAIASGDLLVRPGRTLYVLAGGRGVTQQGPAAGTGGFNGGASGGILRLGNGFSNYLSGGGGGGGGASDVRTCSISDRSCNTLASRLIVAAGGGGGGAACPSAASSRARAAAVAASSATPRTAAPPMAAPAARAAPAPAPGPAAAQDRLLAPRGRPASAATARTSARSPSRVPGAVVAAGSSAAAVAAPAPIGPLREPAAAAARASVRAARASHTRPGSSPAR